ncbi:MAG: pro-sigmaK processing inhibitor BofA family protein [Dysosmobacter sp.]|nr:pro-sigmaK processing inhibitor BofA family protein [Dysosmobacter sp.]
MDVKLLPLLIGAFLLLALARIFRSPLKLAGKLLLNTLLGFLALWLVAATSAHTGIALGMNLANALVVGVLGLPGFVLLLLLQWVL